MKNKHRVGDVRWEVGWCSKLAFYEDSTDVNHDRCEMSFRRFASREEARAFAEQIYPATTETFGVVEVDQVEFVAYDDDDAASMPHVGYWQHVGTTEYYSGEWE